MSAPFYLTHEKVGETIQRASDGLLLARTNDAIEVSLCFSLAAFAHPALAYLRAMVASDAKAAWARATEAMNRVNSCHSWLAQSAGSVAALGQGKEAWGSANAAAELATVTMRQAIDTYTHWEGAGAAEQAAKAKGQLTAQEELVEVTESLRRCCAQADSVMRSVFQKVAIALATQIVAAEGVAQRAPAPIMNMFSLNSRVKVFASALEKAAAVYEDVREGDGWSGPASELAHNFSNHHGRIEGVAASARAAMPV